MTPTTAPETPQRVQLGGQDLALEMLEDGPFMTEKKDTGQSLFYFFIVQLLFIVQLH